MTVIKNLRNELDERYEILLKTINAVNIRMAQFPEGRIRIQKRGKATYYYLIKDGNECGTLLDNSYMPLIMQLAQKSYLTKVLREATAEMDIIKRMIKKYPKETIEETYLSLSSDRKALIKPIILPDAEFAKQWLEEDYIHKPIGEDIPVFMTARGERVRSKSEQIIADHLNSYGLPYKYECPLKLRSGTIHPDFTIMRLSDRTVIYHEHCGRMDDPEYSHKLIRRINDYAESDILIGDRLFMTFEDSKIPLDIRILDKMIQTCFR